MCRMANLPDPEMDEAAAEGDAGEMPPHGIAGVNLRNQLIQDFFARP